MESTRPIYQCRPGPQTAGGLTVWVFSQGIRPFEHFKHYGKSLRSPKAFVSILMQLRTGTPVLLRSACPSTFSRPQNRLGRSIFGTQDLQPSVFNSRDTLQLFLEGSVNGSGRLLSIQHQHRASCRGADPQWHQMVISKIQSRFAGKLSTEMTPAVSLWNAHCVHSLGVVLRKLSEKS